ncbi:MAG: KH domain-containing protein [Bacillota bacterium]
MAVSELVKYIARSLVDEPEAVNVSEVTGERTAIIEISVAPDDIGKIIGKRGRIVHAIRTVAKAAAARSGKRVEVEIIE